MKTLVFLTGFIFFQSQFASARPITFEDFDWDLPVSEVELKAAQKGYHLLKKTDKHNKVKLKYRATVMAEEGVVSFSFTPLSKKLFAVTVNWKGTAFGSEVHQKLKNLYQTPREEMSQIRTYIWTRKNTELELRYDRKETILIYSNLNSWNDYREENKIIDERKQEEDRR